MVYTFDNPTYLVRLDRGDSLSEAMESFIEQTGVRGAWITGLGGVLEVTLGFFELEAKQYSWKKFDKPLEIAAFQGNIAVDEWDKPIYHFHGVFGDADFQTVGGHVKDLVAGGTVELTVVPFTQRVQRSLKKEVGLRSLDITSAE
jgi:predicted DNA-binding protein with PD1-like motif